MKVYVISFIKSFPDDLMERSCEVFTDKIKANDYFVTTKNNYIDKYIQRMKDVFDSENDSIYDCGCVTETNNFWQFVESYGQEEVLIILEEKEVKVCE